MSYLVSPIADKKTDRQNNTKPPNFCKNRKIAESKQTKYELFREKILPPKVSLLGDKGDNYNAEVNTSITFKLKIT